MAFGASTFTDIGGAVSDLFGAQADRYKAQGDVIEGQNYRLAASLAEQNVQYTEASTALKESQQARQTYQVISGQRADIAGAGGQESGSALDLLASSTQQGAIAQQVIAQQGQIQEAGYQEQATSYTNMASAADIAAQAERTAATGADITAGIKAIAGIATIFTK